MSSHMPAAAAFAFRARLRRFPRRARRAIRGVRWFWQRGRRGWADCDAWSADSYIARVLSGVLAHLADHGHAYPGGTSPWPVPEAWDAHLKDLAARLGAWNDTTFLDDDAFEVTRAAMAEFAVNFGVYWD